MKTIQSKDISIVVQGAVDKKLTPKLLKNIRKKLPDAEVILSTWENEEIEPFKGLYDKLVLNADPGASSMDEAGHNYNLNRQLLSTKNGLKLAERKYILKVRSDILIENTKFLKYFDKFNIRDEKYSLFKNKVLTSSLYTIWAEKGTKSEKDKYHYTPYHISDWWHFGLNEDIKLLFSCELVDIESFSKYFTKPQYEIEWLNHRLWQFPPEQYLGVELAKKKFKDLNFEHCLDYKNIDLEQSKHFIIDNFITLDYKQSGIILKKSPYKKMCKSFLKVPPHVFFTMYDFLSYKLFYYKFNRTILRYIYYILISLKYLYYKLIKA